MQATPMFSIPSALVALAIAPAGFFPGRESAQPSSQTVKMRDKHGFGMEWVYVINMRTGRVEQVLYNGNHHLDVNRMLTDEESD